MDRKELTVWGMGNRLLCDDAAGVIAAELLADVLKERGTAGVCVHAVETSPANFVSSLRRECPKAFLLIDASDMGLSGGEIRRFPLSRLEGAAFSSHDFPVDMMIADALPPDCDAQVIAIQPVSCDFCVDELTEPVRAAAQACASLVADGRVDEIAQLED